MRECSEFVYSENDKYIYMNDKTKAESTNIQMNKSKTNNRKKMNKQVTIGKDSIMNL